jgi:two-component sensor histidine kinase
VAILTSKITFTDSLDRAKHSIARNTTFFASIIFAVVCWFLKDSNVHTHIFYYYLFSGAMSLGSSIFLIFSKKHEIVYYGMAFGGSVIIQLAANFGDHSLHYAGFTWLILAIMFCFIGANKIFSVSLIFLNIIGIINFSIFHFHENLFQLQREISTYNIISGIEVASILMLITYMMFRYIDYSKKAQNDLKDLNKALEKKNELITNQNEEKTVLVKEIHHRIKNNLQIIISLLRMQRMEMDSEEGQENFTEAINRIMTMSLIHQKLYKEEELSKIDLKSYIEELVNDLISVSMAKGNVKLEVETNIEYMGLDMVVPLGLLINELVSNTLKYAFIETDGGTIKIRLNQSGPSYGFAYHDNGVWIEPEEGKTGFGTELIDILTEQLNGTKKFNLENGTTYNFTLKEPTYV